MALFRYSTQIQNKYKYIVYKIVELLMIDN